jgi:PAS domain S-box-containing protein
MDRHPGNQPSLLPLHAPVPGPFPGITKRMTVLLRGAMGLLLAGIFAWDLVTPLGQTPWLLYAPVLLFTLLLPYRWDALWLAACCTLLIVCDFFLSQSRVDPGIAIFNRSVGLVMIWVTALGCFFYKQAQQALTSVQNRLSYLIQNNPAVVYIRLAGKEWVFTYLSENVQDVLGFAPSAFLEDVNFWPGRIHPEDRAGILAEGDAAHAHHSFEYRFLHKDGAYRWLRDEVRLVHEPTGEGAVQPVCIGFCSDITERKQAEEALRISESRLRAILDNSPNLIFVKDLEGRYLLVNREFEWTLSVAHDQIVGKTDLDVFPPAQAAVFRANDHKVMDAGHALEFEEEAMHKDGLHTSIVYKFPLHDHQGNPYAIGGIATDITERKRVAAALHAKETLLSTVIQVEPECVKLVNRDGSLIMMNDAGLRMIEADSLEQVVGHCVYPLVVEPHRRQFQTLIERTFQGETGILAFEIVGLKGTRRWLEIHATPLRDETGRITAAVSVTRDITVKKRSEEALKESEARHRIVMRATNDVIWDWDLQTNALWWSDNFFEVFGYRRETMEAGVEAWMTRLHPDDRDRVLNDIFLAIQEKRQIWSDEYRLRRADGSYTYVYDRGYIHLDGEGSAVRMTGAFMDITARKQAEELLRNSRDELRALSSHLQSVREQERARIARELHDEFGQVLTGLKIDLSWLGDVLRTLGKSKKVKQLGDRTRIMNRLVDESIATIRKLVAELRPAVLDHLDLVEALEWQARDFQQRTRIACDFRCALVGVDLDQDHKTAVFRIVQEALTNVARHAKAAQVTICLEEAGDQLHLVVEDNGRGITDHEIASPSSFGILGMQERAELLGGQLLLYGRPDFGTIVSVRFPTKPEILPLL